MPNSIISRIKDRLSKPSAPAAPPGRRPHPFVFRPGTLDEKVFQWVAIDNEYLLPDRLAPDDIVIDVGTHIGSFCYAALERGSNRVYGFEAEAANYTCAARNLQSYGQRVTLYQKAVWRSDRRGDRLFHTGYKDYQGLLNTAGGNVLWGDSGESMEVIAFDDIVLGVTENGKHRVRIAKFDCESSEFPIILTSRTLNLIDTICGEYQRDQRGLRRVQNGDHA